MKQVADFSCKHDILIKNKDGSYTHMDEPHYETELIAPGTWQIMSSGDYHYLVAGDKEAISIDTGYGPGNLREYLEGLCGLPVRSVINTHHHFDHTANNYCFEKAYMAEESVPLAAIPYKSFEGIEFPRDYQAEVVNDGDIIPLEGRELEIFKIGDHTAGGIAILDRKERLLFTGDEFMIFGKNLNGTLEKFAADTEKIHEHRAQFDRICAGFGVGDASLTDIFYEAGQKILVGELEECEPLPRDGHPMKMEETGPNGEKVYDCQFPHKEDMPPFMTGGGTTKKRCFNYGGKQFSIKEENA